jgi:hypothetical protein
MSESQTREGYIVDRVKRSKVAISGEDIGGKSDER